MIHPSRSKAVAKASAGALLAAAAVIAGPVQSAYAVPAFYTPPAELPEANGTVIKYQSMKLGANIPSPNGNARRFMYKSTDTNGTPVAVTGVYIEPLGGAWKGAGDRPLVTYAEGTQGQGDECAPSLGLENAIGFAAGSLNIGYEVPNIAGLVKRGFAVVVTDYIGLGTPGVHTYVNRVDQGHAVLDAARAAIALPGSSVTENSPVGAYGYSQGGGASASAAELQPTYAPELNLKAAFAGAPPANLTQVMRTADGTSLTAVIGFAVNGFLRTYPQLQSVLDANTNNAGRAALKDIAGRCIGDSIPTYGFSKTSKWTVSGRSISQVVAANPAVQAIVDEQRIGRLKPNVPVMINTGTLDDIVTHSQVKQLAKDWCDQGSTVMYVPVRQSIPSFGTSLNHLGPMLVEGTRAGNWLASRLVGENTPPNNCSILSQLP